MKILTRIECEIKIIIVIIIIMQIKKVFSNHIIKKLSQRQLKTNSCNGGHKFLIKVDWEIISTYIFQKITAIDFG